MNSEILKKFEFELMQRTNINWFYSIFQKKNSGWFIDHFLEKMEKELGFEFWKEDEDVNERNMLDIFSFFLIFLLSEIGDKRETINIVKYSETFIYLQNCHL